MTDQIKRTPTKAEVSRLTPLGANGPVTTNKHVAVKAQAPAPDVRDPRDEYLDETAPASFVGRVIKFRQEGIFVTPDTGDEVSPDDDFIALCDQTLIGWVRFGESGERPENLMGLWADGFKVQPRNTLSDPHEEDWDTGTNGRPKDPWNHFNYLVLQHARTEEMFTFVTQSKTGRQAVGNLLRHYRRTSKTSPDELPIVKLRSGGFQHPDSQVGFVKTPVFVVVGATRRGGPQPNLLDDALPF